nr:hypothetical protein [Nostoc sp. C057]
MLVGFLTGVGIQVAIGQLGGLLDLKGGGIIQSSKSLIPLKVCPMLTH